MMIDERRAGQAGATKRGTLLDVARQCNVSQSTVSRVLNNNMTGRFSVSPEVTKKIRQVATELNYRPNMVARNLTVGKTNLVAVLGLRSLDSEKVGPVERAIEAFAGKLDDSGYEICFQLPSKRHSPFDLPPLRVDGVIAVGPESTDQLQLLEASGLPYISLDGVVGMNGTLVKPDDAQGVLLSLQHLYRLGHRRIAYLTHPAVDAKHPSVLERSQAFYAAQSSIGFVAPVDDLPQLPPNTAWDSYFEPFLRKMVLQEGATAVLAYSHYSALALLRTAHELGLSVPKNFSLACFNDEPITQLSVPSLTAFAWPAVELGEAGADLLLSRMNGSSDDLPKVVQLQGRLIERESTARLASV